MGLRVTMMAEVDPAPEGRADEKDVNDWLELFWGSLLVVIGLNQLMHPGVLFAPITMQWLASGVIALGLAWMGHGLKDMAVKEMRAPLEPSTESKRIIEEQFSTEAYAREFEKMILNACFTLN